MSIKLSNIVYKQIKMVNPNNDNMQVSTVSQMLHYVNNSHCPNITYKTAIATAQIQFSANANKVDSLDLLSKLLHKQ